MSPGDFRPSLEHDLLEKELSQKNRIIQELKAQIEFLLRRNEKLKHDKEVYDEVIDYILQGADTIVKAAEEGLK